MLIRRVRPALLPALALALVTCVAEPTTAPHADGTLNLPIHLALIAGAADATALPINQIRAVVRGVSGREAGTVLLDTRLTVDPSALSWEIGIEVPLTGASAEVVVLLSLIHRAADGTEQVEFSGITPPMTVRAGASVEPADVDLVRGPLANLYVTGVSVVDAPVLMLVGQTATLEAAATSSEPQPPSVLWVSLDPLVAAVVGTEITALTPGSTPVIAVAGAFSDTINVTVEAVPADLAVFKAGSVTEVLEGGTADFEVTVVNGGGVEVEGFRVTDDLPLGLVLESFEVTSGTLDLQAQPMQWTLGPLPAGASATLSLTVSVATGTVGTTLTNTAEILLPLGFEDPNPNNNIAQASVSVIRPVPGTVASPAAIAHLRIPSPPSSPRPSPMLDAPGDRLETLLSDYEQRKQDETRRLVQKALVLEEDRKRGAAYLRGAALQHTRDVAERLQHAGHGVVYQELLDGYPPNVRIHLYRKASPLEDEKPGRTTLEITWGEAGSDEVIAKRWNAEGLSSARNQAVVAAEELDDIWVREQLLTFVREVLDLA